jgi:hypothetical protein
MVEVTFAGLEDGWEIRVEYDPPDDPITRGERYLVWKDRLQIIQFTVQPFRKLTWELDWYVGGTYAVVGSGEFVTNGKDEYLEWDGTTFVMRPTTLQVPTGRRALDLRTRSDTFD